MPAVFFWTYGTIGGGCFSQGGEGYVREDTSFPGYASVKLFGRGVEDVEVGMSTRGPGGKRLCSLICIAWLFDSRSENFAAHKHAGTIALVHYL